jgi:hypothetical protein
MVSSLLSVSTQGALLVFVRESLGGSTFLLDRLENLVHFLFPLPQGASCLAEPAVGLRSGCEEGDLFNRQGAIGESVLESDLEAYRLVELLLGDAAALGFTAAVSGDVYGPGEDGGGVEGWSQEALERCEGGGELLAELWELVGFHSWNYTMLQFQDKAKNQALG